MADSTSNPGEPPELVTARPEFLEGVRLYNSGQFYEAHEQWEILWLAEERDEIRLFLQGLIQLTSAFHKLFGQRRPEGASRLLERALAKLDAYPEEYLGVALGPLREGARASMSPGSARTHPSWPTLTLIPTSHAPPP